LLAAVLVLLLMGSLAGLGLGVAARKFHVETDPRIEVIFEALPGTNCGACGYPGCMGFAEAIVTAGAPPDGCTAGGPETAEAVAGILGVEVEEQEKMVALVLCGGGPEEAGRKSLYTGIPDCRAAHLLGGGDKGCQFGCLGYATCVRACPFDAIHMNDRGLAEVDREKCTACGICVTECPVNVIKLVPERSMVHVLCNSKNKGADVRKLCKVGCIACMLCQKHCPSEAVEVKDLLAFIDYDRCNHARVCIGKCPTKCIVDLAPERAPVEEETREVAP
jgi:electron transport complex protein RnfB